MNVYPTPLYFGGIQYPCKVQRYLVDNTKQIVTFGQLRIEFFILSSIMDDESSSSAKPVSILPNVVFGLRTDIKGNIHFTAKNEVIYPVSGVIAIHDYVNKKQKFLRLAEKMCPTIISMSPNRKMLAISEWNEMTHKYN